MNDQTNEEGGVHLVAVDSFHTSQTGTVPARAKFETHRSHADDLIKRGLAKELGQKVAPVLENKMAASVSTKTKPSDGLKVDELKAALEAKGIPIPEGAKKQDLADLLDGAK